MIRRWREASFAANKLNAARAWALTYQFTPRCTGYCLGAESAETLIEDLTCPLHGIEAQKRAEKSYVDRQAWLDALMG